MRTEVRWGLAALIVAALVVGAAPAGAKDKDKDAHKGPTLRLVPTYAEAVAEAKRRNTLLYAIFHKDH